MEIPVSATVQPYKLTLNFPSVRLIVLLMVWMTPALLVGQSVITGNTWFPIGPADVSNGQTSVSELNPPRIGVSGRATVIAVNPQNPDELWLGTASGGVWHSTNAGANFTPISDDQASLAIGDIALDNCSASGCSTLYVGTGENGIRRDTYYGMGLLIGQLSGIEFPTFTWTLVGLDKFKFASINNVVLDPGTSGSQKVIYLSLSSGVTTSASEAIYTAPKPPQGYGIYKSSDQGSTWNLLTIAGSSGSKPTDLVMDPTDSKVLYAGFIGKGIFKTTDGGTTWCPLNLPILAGCPAASGLPDPSSTTFDAVRLAIYRPKAASPAVIYALLGNCPDPLGNGPLFGGYCSSPLYQSTDGGMTWSLVNPTAQRNCSHSPGDICGGFSRYHQALTVEPTNSGTVYLGGYYLSRSIDSGKTFNDIGLSNLHPDHHALVFPNPLDTQRMYEVSDGGFASSRDGGKTWDTSGNSDLQITGFQSMSWSPLTARIIGGSQDNGTEMWVGTRVWSHIDDGDSASTVMDLDNVNTMFDVYFNTPFFPTINGEPSYGVRVCPDGFSSCGYDWFTKSFGIDTSDPTAIYSPVTESTGAPHNLYFGTNRVYQSTDKGSTWTPISPVLGGTATFYPDIGTTNVITAIAVAPNNPNRIYIGYYDGQIWVTSSPCASSACWTPIGGASNGLPQAPVTRIGVDPSQADIAYATFSGFGNGAHLFKTTTGGPPWTPLVNNLPSIPMNTITVENSKALWLGADNGVYQSLDGGSTWNRYGGGLPSVPVYEIALDVNRGRLYAGTHGRGVYILTQPLLNNFEGWVSNDIWDVVVYGSGFVDSLATPAGSPCTMQLFQQNGGPACASSTTDAMGGTITFDKDGNLYTTKGAFYNKRQVALGCYNGQCIGNKTIAQCNPPGNPLTSVTVSCGTQVGIDHITDCPVQANPPSSLVGLSSMGTGGSGSGGGAAPGGPGVVPGGGSVPAVDPPPLPSNAATIPAMSFDLIPSVQSRTGVQVLCTANVVTQAGDTPAAALLRARDAVNASSSCQQSTAHADVRGIPPQPARGEDLLASPPNLTVRAPGVTGGQLFTVVHAPSGSATGVCFAVDGLGNPLRNQLAVMKVDFETSSGGATGGDVVVQERSSLGSCAATLHTTAGESASDIAKSLANTFQAPGLPGPASCPANQNPRDIVSDGTSLVSVLASELRVCSNDNNVGFLIGPKELPNVRHRALQYAAKFLCGPMERKEHEEEYEEHHRRKVEWGPVARGTYHTAVNIHNPADKPVAVRFKFAAALPNGKVGAVSRFSEARLGADEATSLDCSAVYELLQLHPEFVDGFAIIESDVELDVIAIYTAAGEHERVESLHTERIPARLQP